ncbi:probable protein ABIL3 [Phragmites australis]|uniref:probable protein ABIL3 n=1 Tax=Phragmites australis TaxID=29695 RepID=UPI002D786ED8|nr:probable protein ABIL3 [Phragmites australis]XP_062188791.1 probable protein ABIL3 [Phragmites australis]
MEAVAMSPSSVSSHSHDAASNSEDMSLQQGLLFSDSLKDLRNLRSQLYSAAEYFEVFYRNNSHKSTIMASLKDYTVEALVSTVDHLGFVSYKVDNLVSEKADEVNETEFQVSSVEQRVRICQQIIDQEGRSQQSLLIRAPKYHRRYILPGADLLESSIHPVSEPPRYNRPYTSRKMHKSQSSISTPVCRQTTIRRARSPSPTPNDAYHRSRSLSPSRKAPSRTARAKSPSPQIVNSNTKETRAGSPIPNSNPLARSATVSRRPPVNPKHFRQTSMQLHTDCDNHREQEKSSSKGRGFLKSLLTRRRWRNDESLYSYLDEY